MIPSKSTMAMKGTFLRVLQVLLSAALFAGLSACAQNPVVAQHQVFEMRSDIVRPVRPAGDQHLAWLDENRVLFEGWDRELKDTEPATRTSTEARRGLYIWNIRTGEVTRYTRDPLRSFLCFADGYVNYVVSREGRQIRLEGPFGHEKPVIPLANEARDREVNRFTCRSYERSSLPKPIVGGGIEPLRPEHGWVEHTGNTTWFRSPNDELKLLTHDGRSVGPVSLQKYSAASGKYVFWRPSDNKTWLISGAGVMDLQPLPKGPLQRGRLEPAASGSLLLRSRQLNTRSKWDPGASGLYIYQASGEPERLITGLIDAMQVGAKGCLIAAIVDPWDRGREHKLKVLNGCSGGSDVGK